MSQIWFGRTFKLLEETITTDKLFMRITALSVLMSFYPSSVDFVFLERDLINWPEDSLPVSKFQHGFSVNVMVADTKPLRSLLAMRSYCGLEVMWPFVTPP